MEDDKIVQLFLDRDENAIRFSAEKYGTRLRAVSLSITSDYQTAEECENDTYLQAWNLIPPNEPRTFLYSFLARITRHISIDRCREQNTLKRSAIVIELNEDLNIPASVNIESEIIAKELGIEINRFLHSLSQEQRVLFVRRYFFMESIADISKKTDISEGKIKTILFRLRKKLRKHLIKEGYMQ